MLIAELPKSFLILSVFHWLHNSFFFPFREKNLSRHVHRGCRARVSDTHFDSPTERGESVGRLWMLFQNFPVEVTRPLLAPSSDTFPAALAAPAAAAPLRPLPGTELGPPRLQRAFAPDPDGEKCMAGNF